MKIGIMGVPGSFAEMASEKYAHEHSLSDATYVPLVNTKGVLQALDEGKIDKGVFGIENSIGGVVVESIHAMSAHVFTVETFVDIEVHHMLLVKPGVTLDQIKTVSSHDQALKQCQGTLNKLLPEAAVESYIDTAKSAEDLAAGILPESTAVIASRRAASLYELDIAAESIQDQEKNYTTFIVASK